MKAELPVVPGTRYGSDGNDVSIYITATKLCGTSDVGPSRRAPMTRVGCEQHGILVSHFFQGFFNAHADENSVTA